MPPRYLTLAIVAFWLTTTSWLYQRDLRPRLWPGGPPPFVIDLTDEAHLDTVRWTIFKDGEKKGYSETSVRYVPADDLYELRGVFKLWTVGRVFEEAPDQMLDSMYRVTREGELRGIKAEASLRHQVALNVVGINLKQTYQMDVQVEGFVQDQLFRSHLHVQARNLGNPQEKVDFQFDLEPVPVAQQGSVLNPLQPVHRLPNLQPGQHWSMPIVNPLTDAMRESAKAFAGPKLAEALHGAASVPVLQARVLSQPQTLTWGDQAENVSCLVIEYEGEDVVARTWVRRSNGLILQQEIKDHDQELLLIRDY